MASFIARCGSWYNKVAYIKSLQIENMYRSDKSLSLFLKLEAVPEDAF